MLPEAMTRMPSAASASRNFATDTAQADEAECSAGHFTDTREFIPQ